ncbi:putative membrane protein YkoI [Bacillus pakistanensis]|uniref:Membrane protein YkoI n=1 Tax=Rossellomorea pakistanensis TaxID=992288 RepID=A0ABS2NC94_9BACI|nr:PepSY domain-containing protein [Bacillus pakistanensis]MBM7585487.1 putative membrane protein YkoI [Bacillus pakistanensis]
MKLKVGLIMFILLGLSFTLFHIFIKDDPKIISKKEAEAIATNVYGGKVLTAKVNQENDNFQLRIENEKGIYQMDVDSETKKMSNVKLVERKETLNTIEDAKKNIEKEVKGQVNQIKQVNKDGKSFVEATVEKNEKKYRVEYDLKENAIVFNKEVKSLVDPSPSISEQKAKEIALQQMNGQVTNLSIITAQNGKHYKVTVDDHSEGAHVYVQANTGEVSSISLYSKEQPKPPIEVEDDNDEDNEDDFDEDDQSEDSDD